MMHELDFSETALNCIGVVQQHIFELVWRSLFEGSFSRAEDQRNLREASTSATVECTGSRQRRCTMNHNWLFTVY
jgi:hypothetical protein